MFKIRIRVFVGIMIFFGYFLLYIVRYGLSVHIVDMVLVSKKEQTMLSRYEADYVLDGIVEFQPKMVRMLEGVTWDNMRMGQLFSAYHIGYCVCFPIFLNLGDRLGTTWVVGIAGTISGVMSCVVPSAAYLQFWLIFVVRMIQGFCAGAILPNMVQVLRHWVPPVERHHFMWAYCGITTGTFCTFLLCGAIEYYSQWYVGFYISGAFQVFWSVMWVLTITDYPRDHPLISQEELTYLVNAIGNIFTIKLTNAAAPWLMIIKSIPFWALCILNFGYSWMIISMAIHGPLFYNNVGRYRIHMASILTALPFFFRLVLGTAMIHLFQHYKNKPQISQIKHIRKYFIVVSHVLPGLVLVVLWLTPIFPGPITLTFVLALTAAGMDLTLDLCYELSPTYMNSINTVVKLIGNTAGIIVSLSVGHITQQYKDTAIIWKHIWCFHGAILLISGVIFLIWGESEIQPWNYVRKDRPQQKLYTRTVPRTMSNIAEVDNENSDTISLAAVELLK